MVGDGGWMAVCKKHRKKMIKDIESRGWFVWGYSSGDRRMKCNYPKCKIKAEFEVFYSKEKPDLNSSKFVPLCE